MKREIGIKKKMEMRRTEVGDGGQETQWGRSVLGCLDLIKLRVDPAGWHTFCELVQETSLKATTFSVIATAAVVFGVMALLKEKEKMEGVLFLQMSIFAVLEVFQTLYMRPMYHYIVSSRVDFLDHPILKGRYYNSMLAYTLTFISLTYVLSALMVLVLAFQSTFGSSDQHVFLVWCILLPLLFLSATTQFFVIV